jgi:hypothetical protein
MDIRYHLRILWRWRVILFGGLVLATLLAFLVTFKPTLGGAEWRSQATFKSTSRVMVTQPGFPLGRATLPGSDPTQPAPQPGVELNTFAPSERFSELAVIYSFVAQSDQVRELIRPEPLRKQISVVNIPSPATGDPLPLLEVATTANSREAARVLNNAVIRSLREYLERNVRRSGVPTDQSVELQVLNPPEPGKLAGGRSLTLPVIVWFLAMAAALVAVYLLENLYPTMWRREEPPQHSDGAPEPELELIEGWDSLGEAPPARRVS